MTMSNRTDVEIWASQIARWNEQAAVIAKRIECKQVMFSAGAIDEKEFEHEMKSLEADRMVYIHVVEEAEQRLKALKSA
jgi:hypothetical protein